MPIAPAVAMNLTVYCLSGTCRGHVNTFFPQGLAHNEAHCPETGQTLWKLICYFVFGVVRLLVIADRGFDIALGFTTDMSHQ